jgi:hypothetical protein
MASGTLLAAAVALVLLSGDTGSSAQQTARSQSWYWAQRPVEIQLSSLPDSETGRVELRIYVDERFTVCGGGVSARVEFLPQELEGDRLSYHGLEQPDPDLPAYHVETTIDVELARRGEDWVGTVRLRQQGDPDSCGDIPPLSYDSGMLNVRLALARSPVRPTRKLTFRLVQRGSGKPAIGARVEASGHRLRCRRAVCTGRFRPRTNVVFWGVNDKRWTFYRWGGYCRRGGTYLSCALRIRGNHCSVAIFMRGQRKRPNPRLGPDTPGRCPNSS